MLRAIVKKRQNVASPTDGAETLQGIVCLESHDYKGAFKKKRGVKPHGEGLKAAPVGAACSHQEG